MDKKTIESIPNIIRVKAAPKRIEDIPNAIKIRDGSERHPIEAIPGAIVVKRAAPKPTEAELLQQLADEARDRQRNRKFIPPKHGTA